MEGENGKVKLGVDRNIKLMYHGEIMGNTRNFKLDDLVSSNDAAKELGCTPRTVRNLIHANELDGVEVNFRWTVTRRSLERYKMRNIKIAVPKRFRE